MAFAVHFHLSPSDVRGLTLFEFDQFASTADAWAEGGD